MNGMRRVAKLSLGKRIWNCFCSLLNGLVSFLEVFLPQIYDGSLRRLSIKHAPESRVSFTNNSSNACLEQMRLSNDIAVLRKT